MTDANPPLGWMIGEAVALPADITNCHRQLLVASYQGDQQVVQTLLAESLTSPIDLAAHDQHGRTALLLAAWTGQLNIVRLLLESGASWHAQDDKGLTAGEYAVLGAHELIYDELVSAGVRSELILQALSDGSVIPNSDYLRGRNHYTEHELIDSHHNGVMMTWETPLMEAHAHVMQCPSRHVLNVGFGMGIIDTEIQRLRPSSHTIIEAHPDVYTRMIEQGWDRLPGVKIIFGRWQDVLPQLETYDAIMFDTFDETDADLANFHDALFDLLRPHGIYTFFNGLAATNPFFHDVCCEVTRLSLAELGLQVRYVPVPINISDDHIWQNVKDKYWTLKQYNLPICTFQQYIYLVSNVDSPGISLCRPINRFSRRHRPNTAALGSL